MHRLSDSFPHCERNLKRREIAVENSYFSTLSTWFSTRVFHSYPQLLTALWVHITRFDKIRQKVNFYAGSNFHESHRPCAKITPLTRVVTGL